MKRKKEILGIIGGMGPAATIELQRLIVENTPATKDQDHIETLVHNDTLIPDRTLSLREDGGSRFVNAIVDSGNKLISAGATFLCIPCNTAHARFGVIQSRLSRPIFNMITLVSDHILAEKIAQPILILGTTGTLAEGVFSKEFSQRGISFMVPDRNGQKSIDEIIYKIKANNVNEQVEQLQKVILRQIKDSPDISFAVLLGCTELSLLSGKLNGVKMKNIQIVDPLQILAKHIVSQYQA